MVVISITQGKQAMAQDNSTQDPLDFVRGMWNSMGFSLPGMVTPTLDVDELDKRIADLKAVESWLKMNLNMLQMTTQGLEMQRATLAAMQAMSQQARDSGDKGEASQSEPNPFAAAASAAASMWPWNLMGAQPPAAEHPTDKPKQTATKKPRSTTTARKNGDEKK